MYLDKKAEIIAEYIKDSRYKQAVLINGDWGSGKTFFVENKLMDKLNGYIVIRYSLYGVHSSEQLLSDIQKEMLIKVIENKEFKIKDKTFNISSKILDLAPNITNILWKRIGFEAEDLNELLNKIDFDKTKLIIIFDDLERSCIDINEVLGIINSFVECHKTKVIIIANEKEIGSSRISTNLPEKFLVAADKTIILDNETNQIKSKSSNNECRYTYNELISRTKKLFSNDIVYNSIKEKLIGLSVTIFADFNQIYDNIVNENAPHAKEFLINHKDEVIDILQSTNCQNIRTLIFGVITFDNIFQKIILLEKGHTDSEYLKLLYEETTQILRSVIYTSIIYKSGEKININGSSFSSPYNAISVRRLKKYPFVNKYICNHEFDYISTNQILDAYIKETINDIKQKNETDNLSLYKLYLYEWAYLRDDDVIKYMDQLYEELESNKYDARYFREIITILVQLNHNFKEKISKLKHNADDYIKLMKSYIYTHGCTEEAKQYFETIFTDGNQEQLYSTYTSSIIKAIHETENKEYNDTKERIFNRENWAEKFYDLCKNHSDDFLDSRQFLSSFKIESIKTALHSATNRDIQTFSRAVCSVYYFSNINDYYQSDIDSLTQIIETLKEIRNNPNTDCTKKIILKTYIEKLEQKLSDLS